MLDGKDKDKALKVFDTELSPMDISVVRKDNLKEKLKVARKAVADVARGLEKEQSKAVSHFLLLGC